MMPQSTSSTATSIDATQRKLIVGIVLATLMAWAIVIADLASGGRPDPPSLRAAATCSTATGDSAPAMTRAGRTPVRTTAVGRRSI